MFEIQNKLLRVKVKPSISADLMPCPTMNVKSASEGRRARRRRKLRNTSNSVTSKKAKKVNFKHSFLLSFKIKSTKDARPMADLISELKTNTNFFIEKIMKVQIPKIEKNDTGSPFLGFREIILVMGTRSNAVLLLHFLILFSATPPRAKRDVLLFANVSRIGRQLARME